MESAPRSPIGYPVVRSLSSTNRFRSCVTAFTATRLTSGVWNASVVESAYAGNVDQSLKSPSIRMIEVGPPGDGERKLTRIGTITMRATTAAIPTTEWDQWGCAGIRGVP